MTDAREKQPASRTIDYRENTKGNLQYSAKIRVSTYHSIKNEDVYSRDLTILYRACRFEEACGFALAISKTISLAHDVWQVNLHGVWEGWDD